MGVTASALTSAEIHVELDKARRELKAAQSVLGRAVVERADETDARRQVDSATSRIAALEAALVESGKGDEAEAAAADWRKEAARRVPALLWRAEYLRRQAKVARARAALEAASARALAMGAAPDVHQNGGTGALSHTELGELGAGRSESPASAGFRPGRKHAAFAEAQLVIAGKKTLVRLSSLPPREAEALAARMEERAQEYAADADLDFAAAKQRYADISEGGGR